MFGQVRVVRSHGLVFRTVVCGSLAHTIFLTDRTGACHLVWSSCL
jgi:hypothetical protein